MNNFQIQSTLNSTNCKIESTLETQPQYIYITKALIFIGICIFFQVWNFILILRSAFSDEMMSYNYVSENFILFNMLIDIIITIINISFCMRMYDEYFELFMIYMLVSISTIFFKLRIYIQKVEINIMGVTTEEEEIERYKKMSFIKVVTGMVLVVYFSTVFV